MLLWKKLVHTPPWKSLHAILFLSHKNQFSFMSDKNLIQIKFELDLIYIWKGPKGDGEKERRQQGAPQKLVHANPSPFILSHKINHFSHLNMIRPYSLLD